jgi:hypothetical protein
MQNIVNTLGKKLILVCMTMCCSLLFAQPLTQDSVQNKFDLFRKNNLQEKIFAHINQNFYMVGETVWFALYVVDGTIHKPSEVSKVAYVEILDNTNKAVIQTKVNINDGTGDGSFFLPATLQSGNYIFRCYTNWMKNFDTEFFFHQQITIANPFVKSEPDKKTASKNVHVDFFPEGGYLVGGLKSKIGFKITDDSGNYANAKVSILNEANDTIVIASPIKFGLGNFSFTPNADVKYKAVARDANGNTSVQIFPAVKSVGAVMAIADNGENLSVTVTKNIDELFQVYLFAHCRNSIFKKEVKRFTGNQAVFTIDKSLVGEGISQFTIFNENFQPIAERLYFKKPKNSIAIQASSDIGPLKTRRKVSIPLSFANTANTNFSVSVVRNDSLTDSQNQDIVSYLWLTSDIKGQIDSPDYYFSQEESAEAADNLMLTQGWRRFSWEQVFTQIPAKSFAPEFRGHIITGKVTNKNDSSSHGVLTYLSTPGKIINLYPSRSDAQGLVIFEPSEFFGQHKLILQAEPKLSKAVNLEILSPFASTFSKRKANPYILNPELENLFLDRSVSMQVQDVYYEETITPATATIIDSIAFYGIADETYYLDKYTRFPVMEEVMREYVPGVMVRKRKDGFHFIVLDIVNGGVLNDDPMMLVDGVPLFDADQIINIDPRLIRKLEVVKRNYYNGPIKLNGVVSYTSYQGDLGATLVGPEAVSINYDGLQLQREFYSPRYETQKQIDSRMPDRRYQLYWNPLLKTGPDGKALIEFYTSDVQGTFALDIQTLDTKGNAGYLRKTFTVK